MTIRIALFLKSLLICFLAGGLLLNGAEMVAQSPDSGTIAGVLVDPSGRAVGGARVIARQKAAGQNAPAIAETQSRDDGSFALTVPPGKYSVTITQDTFAKANRDVEVVAGKKVEWNLTLEIAPLSASVIVTAQAQPAEASNSTIPVTVVTREEIDQQAATSLPDLLSTQPGFSLARTGPEGGQTTLFLDGGNSNHTKVLLDGAPMNGSGGFTDYSNMALDNVDKIEVIHGGESAIYGSDAVAGVIQVFTHRGETRTPELDVEGDGGSFSTGHGSAQVSGLLGRLDYDAGTSYLSTVGQGPNDFFYNRGLSGNIGYKFSDTDTLRIVVRNNTSDAGIPGQTLLIPPDLTQDNNLHDFFASAVWNFQTGAHWNWQVSGNEADLRGVDTETNPSFPFVARDQFNRAGFTAQTTYVFRNAALTGGYEYEVENGFPSALGSSVHVRRNNMGGYLDGKWQVTRRLTLNAGARAEDNASFGTRVVPRAGAAYLLRAGAGFWGDTRIHAFYGQGIVEPRLDQSFGTDPCFPGNPNLRPEESRTGSTGIDQSMASGRLVLSADYFYNQLYNVISFGFLNNPPPACIFGAGTFFNTDSARAFGGNISLKARPTRWLSLAGNYSYDDTKVLAAPNASDPAEQVGNRLLRRPLNSGSVILNFEMGRFNANASGYFVGPRTDSAFLQFLGIDTVQMPNPGYARFDVAASYRAQKHVTLFVRVHNLLNRQYQDALGYPALGREILGGVKLRFGGE